MALFLVDLYLDGYESEEEMAKACPEFIYDQLNFAGSGVTVKPATQITENVFRVEK